MRITTNSLEQHWLPFTNNRGFKQDPRLLVKAKGMYYWNHHGDRIIDASSGLFTCAAGHGRTEIADAVYAQLMACDYTPHFHVANPTSFELANKLTKLLPDPHNHVFFVNSGSESIDTSMKIVMAYHRARKEGQRNRFVSRERAYHGVNMGGTSLAGMVKNRETFTNTLPNIVHMRHTHTEGNPYLWGQPENGAEMAEDLQSMVDTYGGSTIAACYVEPVAGSTGVLVPPRGYLERLREICDENGILLVFDEVICGFGRLGKAPFGAQAFGVIPDIITMAKALTNGAQPMGALSVRDEIYETITNAAPKDAIEFFHGYTYSGHPVACAAGIATMDIYENDDLFARGEKTSGYFADAMMALQDIPAVTAIRGYGMMCGLEIDGNGPQTQTKFFNEGLHVKFTNNVGIFAPALIAETQHIDEIVAKIRKVLS